MILMLLWIKSDRLDDLSVKNILEVGLVGAESVGFGGF